MNYKIAVETVVQSYKERLQKAVVRRVEEALRQDELEGLGPKIAKIVDTIGREMADEVAKVVREETLKFYEEKQNQERGVPHDLRDLPLFQPQPMPPPYIPPRPDTGLPPPIRTDIASP